MPTNDKILQEIMCGFKDRSIRFTELQKILEALGFKCRSKGDHFIYYREGVDEIINLQPILLVVCCVNILGSINFEFCSGK